MSDPHINFIPNDRKIERLGQKSVGTTGQDERNATMGQIVDCLFEFIGIAGEDTDGDLVHTTFKDDLLSFSCFAVTAHEEM